MKKLRYIYILVISCITKNFYEVVHTLQISYVYIYIKCIVTNKHASSVLEYNYTNSLKICTSHFNSNDFIKKCDVSFLLGPFYP